jgi:coproporphyrinogen III oxidase-like Fe-S oxidoreductase
MIGLSPDSVTIYQTEIPYNTQFYQRLKGHQSAPSRPEYLVSGIKARPHPGPLPQERENGLAVGEKYLRRGFSGHAGDDSPSPGGEGRGEGEPFSRPISWPEKRARLAYGFAQLERAGYTVVSAYSAIKNPQRHRFQYQEHLWRSGDMLGLGVAAFSYLGGVHFQNAVTLGSYTEQVRQGRLPLKRAFQLNPQDQLVREFILQLKWGEISVADFKEKFKVDITQVFASQLAPLEAEGFLKVTPSAVQLTRAGLLCVDRLLPRFYQPQHQDLRYT